MHVSTCSFVIATGERVVVVVMVVFVWELVELFYVPWSVDQFANCPIGILILNLSTFDNVYDCLIRSLCKEKVILYSRLETVIDSK